MAVYDFPADVPRVLTEYEARRPRRLDWRRAWRGGPNGWFLEADWVRWPRYQARVWRRFDRLQVFSARDAELVRELAPHLASRVRVTPFGIDVPAAPQLEPEEPGTVLFAGNYTHPPNVDAALWLASAIMPRLRMEHAGARLILVGPHAPDAVRACAAEDVEVTGVVPSLGPYLARAAVVAAPVRIGGGMRMKVLHALAVGKPVVTTTRGAYGLHVGGEELPLIVADDGERFAAETAALLADEPRRHALGERARAFIQRHYDADSYGSRVESTYREVIRPPRGRNGTAA
jgi:glycosyltransferase involved in cell wall biosynthesis